jgi:hypothetical protein
MPKVDGEFIEPLVGVCNGLDQRQQRCRRPWLRGGRQGFDLCADQQYALYDLVKRHGQSTMR